MALKIKAFSSALNKQLKDGMVSRVQEILSANLGGMAATGGSIVTETAQKVVLTVLNDAHPDWVIMVNPSVPVDQPALAASARPADEVNADVHKKKRVKHCTYCGEELPEGIKVMNGVYVCAACVDDNEEEEEEEEEEKEEEEYAGGKPSKPATTTRKKPAKRR